jgi:hypothetical protein
MQRVWRALRATLGWVLIAAGVLALALSIPVLLILLSETFTGHESPKLAAIITAALLVAAAAAIFVAGRRIARGRRRLVLFLRRFGFQAASQTITYAVRSGLHQRFRFVTLDDAAISAVGEHGERRWNTVRWLTVIAAAAGTLVVGLSIHRFAQTLTRDLGSQIIDNMREQAHGNIAQEIVAIFAGTIATAAAVVAILTLLILVLAAPVLATTGTAVFSWFTLRSIRRAETSKALFVADPEAVSPTVAQVLQRMRSSFAPRLVVVRCVDSAWRALVLAFAESSRLVLVDISELSEHLLWELSTLHADPRIAFLLIGRRDRVEALATSATLTPAFSEHLEGREVLVYEGDDKRARRRFARALNSRLLAAG